MTNLLYRNPVIILSFILGLTAIYLDFTVDSVVLKRNKRISLENSLRQSLDHVYHKATLPAQIELLFEDFTNELTKIYAWHGYSKEKSAQAHDRFVKKLLPDRNLIIARYDGFRRKYHTIFSYSGENFHHIDFLKSLLKGIPYWNLETQNLSRFQESAAKLGIFGSPLILDPEFMRGVTFQ